MKKELQFKKPNWLAKSEKYEPFCVSKLLFGAKNGSQALGMANRS